MPGVAKGNHIVEDSYFYTLVRPTNPKKKRCCLKCGTVFLSANYEIECVVLVLHKTLVPLIELKHH